MATIEPELNSLLTKLTAEIQDDRREVEIRQKRITRNEELRRAIQSRLGGETDSDYGARTNAVWTAITQIPKSQFMQVDVEEQIAKMNLSVQFSKHRIRNALWAMANTTHKIKLVRKGNTKQPAIYEKLPGVTRYKRTTPEAKEATIKNASPELPIISNGTVGQVNALALENAVRQQSGRVAHLADRLHTSEDTIKSLLEPASRVYIGSAGWLRVRDEVISPNSN